MMHERDLGYADREAADLAWSRAMRQSDLKKLLRDAAARRIDETGWFVVRVQGPEGALAAEMRVCGVEAWCPQKKVLRRVPRQRAKYEGLQPIAPGYLLVELEPNAYAFLGVKSFEGVRHFLGGDSGPVALAPRIVKALRAVDQSGEPEGSGLGMIFSPGETVEVVDGYLSGNEGVVDRGDDRDGVARILIDIFGRLTPVELGIDQLRKLR